MPIFAMALFINVLMASSARGVLADWLSKADALVTGGCVVIAWMLKHAFERIHVRLERLDREKGGGPRAPTTEPDAAAAAR